MQITIVQALIITLFSVFSNLMFPLLGDIGGYFGIGRPMIAGTIVGIILGDVKTGMLIGATLNAVYMNSQAVGNVMSTDVTMAGYTATTLAMAGSNDPSIALALSIPIGMFGAMLFTLQNAAVVFFVHKCDDYAARADIKKIWAVGIWIPFIIFNGIRFISTFPVIYWGSRYSSAVEALMPEWLNAAMGVVGGMLPAVGMALLLKVMITKRLHFCYFMLGFLAYSLFGIGSVPLTFLAICAVAIIDNMKQGNEQSEALESLE